MISSEFSRSSHQTQQFLVGGGRPGQDVFCSIRRIVMKCQHQGSPLGRSSQSGGDELGRQSGDPLFDFGRFHLTPLYFCVTVNSQISRQK